MAAAAAAVPLASLAAQPGAPDRAQSRYWTLPAAASVLASTALRSETIILSQPGKLLVQTDGHAQPLTWPSASSAWIYVTVDGLPVTNTAVVDWRASVAPQPHSFNAVGVVAVTAGTHVVTLQADTLNGGYDLGSANLSVFVNPAQHMLQAQMAADSGEITTTFSAPYGASRCEWGGIPWKQLFSLEMPTQDVPVYVFAAGRVQVVRNAGDAMSSVFHGATSDSRNETSMTWRATFSVQDLYPAAELQGTMSCQGVLYGSPPSVEYRPNFQFGATELPPSHLASQPLAYKVGAGAVLVGLAGGFQVQGAVGKTNGPVCQAACFGGNASGCPALGTPVVMSQATIRVPPGHDGRVFIAGKLRIQGNPLDGASRSTVQLRLDGQMVGNTALQGTAGWLGGWNTTVGQRTAAVSYLATGAQALAPGNHLVELVTTANGYSNPPNVERLSIWDDDPMLVWID